MEVMIKMTSPEMGRRVIVPNNKPLTASKPYRPMSMGRTVKKPASVLPAVAAISRSIYEKA